MDKEIGGKMKLIFLPLLALYTISVGGPSLISETNKNELTPGDQKTLEYLETVKTNKRLKIINLAPSALSSRIFELELFDGEKRSFEIVRIEKENRDSVWKGALSNRKPGVYDRFSLMKVGKRYSGYVFAGGRMYLIQPAFKHHYALVEQDMQYSCGAISRQGEGANK